VDQFLNDDRLSHTSALATAAKIIGSETGVNVAGRVVDIMGSDALDPRWPVEKVFRDAKLTQIYEGTNGANAITCFKNMIGLMRHGV
jgi:alkylation response protein AidB-like acyl-CoA dehydrogenase